MSSQRRGQSAYLADLEPGQRAQVQRLAVQGALGLRLREMGLVPGTPLRLVRRAPLGDPLQLELRGYQLSLRMAEARCVEVESISSETTSRAGSKD